jgi:DNA-binding transcriptional regulator GbsR (MarR family)
MIYIVIMVSSRTQLDKNKNEKPADQVIRRVKALMMNWGFAEGCSAIYAVLIASHEPLSAEEIGKRADYAYSSTISYLNTLIRVGLVERVRSIRKNVYTANVNIVELIRTEHKKVMAYLKQLDDALKGEKDLEHLSEKVEHAIAYLNRIESAADMVGG